MLVKLLTVTDSWDSSIFLMLHSQELGHLAEDTLNAVGAAVADGNLEPTTTLLRQLLNPLEFLARLFM